MNDDTSPDLDEFGRTYRGVRIMDYTVLGFDYGQDGDAPSKAVFDRAYAELEGVSVFRTVNVTAGTWWLLVIAPDECLPAIFEFDFAPGEPVEVDDGTAATVVTRRLRTAVEEWDRDPTEHHYRQAASYGPDGALMHRDGTVEPLGGDDA